MATNRLSTISGASTPVAPRSTAQHSTQVSTTTLLNALHTTYASAQPYRLDASTSLVVNTWLTAFNPNVEDHQGGTVDGDLARQAWEHARRRAEDGCLVLGSVVRYTYTYWHWC
jgi:chitin synthase